MPKVIGLVLIFSFAVRADQVTDQIDRLNKKVKQMRGPEVCTTCGFPAGQEAPPMAWKMCFKDVCGDSIGELGREIDRIYRVPYSENPDFKEFLPLIRQSFREEVELYASINRAVLEFKKSGKAITNSSALRFALIARNGRQDIQYNDRGLVDETRSYDTIVSAGRSSDEARFLIETEKALREQAYKTPEVLSPNYDFFKKELKPEEIDRQILPVFRELDSLMAANAKTLNLPSQLIATTPDELRALEKKYRAGDFDRKDAIKLRTNLYNERMIHFFLNNDKAWAAGKSLPPVDRLPIDQMEKAQREMENFLKGLPPPAVQNLNILAQQEKIISQCYSGIALAAAKLPRQNDVNRFVKSEEPALRRKFMQKLGGYLSAHSRGTIESSVKKAILRPPESREGFLQRIKNEIKEHGTNKKKNREAIQATTSEEKQQVLATMISAFGLPPAGAELLDVCTEAQPDLYTDMALVNSNGRFHLSGSTINGGADTEFTAHHEYSHMVSNFITKDEKVSRPTREWYEAVRNCLTQGHTERGEERVEEDFADVLGMSFTGGGRGFCGWITEAEPSLTLQNWNPDDKDHSGHFYRVLHHRVLTGAGIPESCRAALAEKGEAPFERNCLKETPEAAHR